MKPKINESSKRLWNRIKELTGWKKSKTELEHRRRKSQIQNKILNLEERIKNEVVLTQKIDSDSMNDEDKKNKLILYSIMNICRNYKTFIKHTFLLLSSLPYLFCTMSLLLLSHKSKIGKYITFLFTIFVYQSNLE